MSKLPSSIELKFKIWLYLLSRQPR